MLVPPKGVTTNKRRELQTKGVTTNEIGFLMQNPVTRWVTMQSIPRGVSYQLAGSHCLATVATKARMQKRASQMRRPLYLENEEVSGCYFQLNRKACYFDFNLISNGSPSCETVPSNPEVVSFEYFLGIGVISG